MVECLGLSMWCLVVSDWVSQRDVFESFELLGELAGYWWTFCV